MSTITATADNAKSQVRLDLDFSDIDAPYVLVNRVDPITGATTQVRGHGGSVAVGGTAYAPMQAGYKAVLYDTEAPLDSSFYYTATAPVGALNVNTDFSGGWTNPWYTTNQVNTIRITTDTAGVNYLSFNSDGATSSPFMRAEDIPATPGATLTITGVVSTNGANGVTVGLDFLDANGVQLAGAGSAATVSSTTTITYSAVAPANTAFARPFVILGGTPGAALIASFSSIVVSNAAGSATSGGVTLPSLGACQLKDPLRPGNNVRVDFCFDPNPLCVPSEGIFFQSIDVEQQAANAAVFNINNQANPTVVSKERSAPSSTLTLVSRTFADRDRLIALLQPGSPLLFQVPDEYGVPDQHMSVSSYSRSRVLPDHRFPIRVFSLPYQVVSAPGGPMQGTVGARWQDTCNRYATWGLVNAAGLTWIQILDGLAG
ncbi:MAG TPA: hypothetical protein VFW27_05250 [Actinoplanes sp.]|nr:hypothetical protein [Actinoplanes sp.]